MTFWCCGARQGHVDDQGRLDRRTFLAGSAVLGLGLRFGLDDLGLMSYAEERALGRDLYKDLLTKVTVSKDRARAAAMERIVRRITAIKSIPKNQWEWQVLLVVDDAVNAAAYPGGKLVVTTGMDSFTSGDEDELAVVLGHEVAHVTERHAAKSIRNAQLSTRIEDGIRSKLGRLDPTTRVELLSILEAGTLVGAGLPYGRRQESAADRVGVHYAHDSGFHAEEALVFWRRMASQHGADAQPGFLSTHPSDADRLTRIAEELKKLG